LDGADGPLHQHLSRAESIREFRTLARRSDVVDEIDDAGS